MIDYSMKFFAITFVLISALLIAACGGAPGDSANEPANSSTGTEYSDARVALAEGTRLLDSGETDQAIAVLNQAAKLDPDLADAYFQLGVAYALVEMRDAGVVTTPDANESNTGEKKPKEKKTNSETAFENAVDRYKKMIAANKDDHGSHFNLGRAYNKLNDDEKAEEAFEKAVKLNAEDTEYQTEYGAILIKLAKYREAIPPLKKALELDPDNVEAQELLEDAEAGRKRVDYTSTPKKEEKKPVANSNTSNSNTTTTLPSNTAKPPTTPKPAPTKPPTNRP